MAEDAQQGSLPKGAGAGDDLSVTWCNLSVWVDRKLDSPFWRRATVERQRILNNVSGHVESGCLMAIMGASGAGKTTLLATLSQRMKFSDADGDILLNGHKFTADMMNQISGFVPQHDLAIDSLNVAEHMTFMARMKMDRRVPAAGRRRRIDALLRELGIHKCKHTLLAALSGGERKRLSLAVQLLTDPPLLFCDEPTTGLDSYNASAVIENLKRLAAGGKAVVCTIHQPASGIFDMFSRVLLLAGGRVAFHGDVAGAAKHFDSVGLVCPPTYNLAEFFVTQLAVLPGKEEESNRKINRLCDGFDASKYGQELIGHLTRCRGRRDSILARSYSLEMDQPLDNKYIPKNVSIAKVSRLTQLYWLTWRSVIDIYRNSARHFLKFGLFMMIALLISTPYTNMKVDQSGIQNLQGLMYLIITETIFTFSYSVFHTFPQEMPILLREIGNDIYKPGPYYVSKMLVLLPQTIVEPFFYALVVFYTAHLRGGVAGLLVFCVPVVMCAVTATAYGCAISALFESVPMATLLSVPLDFIAIVFSGLFMQLGNLPIYLAWMPYVSQFYYGIEAVSISQWTQVDSIECSADPNIPCITSGPEVLLKYGYNIGNFYLDIGGLFAIYCVAHVCGFLALWRRSKKQPVY